MKNKFRLPFGTLSLALSLHLPADQSGREKGAIVQLKIDVNGCDYDFASRWRGRNESVGTKRKVKATSVDGVRIVARWL